MNWFIGLMVVAVALSLSVRAETETVYVGDGRLQLGISISDTGLTETTLTIDGHERVMSGKGWSLSTDQGDHVAGAASDDSAGDEALRSAVTFSGASAAFAWRLEYRVTGPARITKFLTLVPRQDMVLQRLSLWDASTDSEPRIVSTSLQDIVAFYRFQSDGLFVSLDFPYSRIATVAGRTQVTYPPFVSLRAGEAYEAHSLTIGAVALTGTSRYVHDDGEVEAMDAYVQGRFESRFNRPMYVYCSIVNRYTQPTADIVWYSYKDHPSLTFRPDLLKRDMELMPGLGMEYYQMFPGPFDWVPGDPDPAVVRDVTDTARALGVRPGTYSTTDGLFCFHYNDHKNTVDHPEWHTVDSAGNQTDVFCLGDNAYVDYHVSVLAEACRTYGFELNCCDGLRLQPCWAENHNHPPGEESVYQQVLGLVKMHEAINAISPEMMMWSNAGNWSEFLPKLAWWNQNMYLTDPFIHTPWQGLNMTRLLDDARREQMVELHNTRFIPYRFLTNFQYLLHQNSVVPDIRNYEFGALSTMAVAPNLGLGEFRPWYESLSPGNQQKVTSFYGKWTRFLNDNYELFLKTFEAGDRPGLGGVEIYGHAEDDHGFIFVVNPNYWDAVVELPLTEELGFRGDTRSEVTELYPVERRVLTAQGTHVQLGTQLPMVARAQQVHIYEVKPAPDTRDEPTLYGLPGTLEKTEAGLRLNISGAQGTKKRFAVTLPPGAGSVVAAEVRQDIPKQPVRDFHATGLTVLGRDATSTLMEVSFRRTEAPTELRQWRVTSNTLEAGLSENFQAGLPTGEDLPFPLFVGTPEETVPSPVWGDALATHGYGPIASFCGAYIENAFQEEQETWIELQIGDDAPWPEIAVADEVPAAPSRPLPTLARSQDTTWWLGTTFHLPFMYSIVSQPHPDEHTLLVLPIANPASVKSIQGWINGVPLEIRRYAYPRNPELLCYWADLVGSGARAGENNLVLHVEF